MGRNSVLLLDGKEHMRQRKLMLPSFHGERMQRYGDVMREVAERGDRALAGGRAVRPATAHPGDHAARSSCARCSASTTPSGSRGWASGSAAMLDIGMQSRALAAIALPQVRRTIGRGIFKRFLRLRAAADAEIYDEIARRRSATDVEERDDVLSILLQARDEDGRAAHRRGAARRADDPAGRRPRDDRDVARVGVRPAAAPPAAARAAAGRDRDRRRRRRVPRRRDQGDAAHPARSSPA